MTSDNYEIRRVQGLRRTDGISFSVVIPKHMAVKIGLEVGDYVKMSVKDKTIILEKT